MQTAIPAFYLVFEHGDETPLDQAIVAVKTRDIGLDARKIGCDLLPETKIHLFEGRGIHECTEDFARDLLAVCDAEDAESYREFLAANGLEDDVDELIEEANEEYRLRCEYIREESLTSIFL